MNRSRARSLSGRAAAAPLAALLLLALPLLALGPARAVAALTPGDRLRFAEGLFTRDRLALARAEYGALLADFPDSPEAETAAFRLAECLAREGRTNDAIAAFGALPARHPEGALRHQARYRAADLLAQAGRADEAAAAFETLALESAPAGGPTGALAAATLYRLGTLEAARARPAAARAAFERLIAEHGAGEQTPAARLALAALETDAGRTNAALAHYEAAAAASPTGAVAAEAWFQIALLRYRAGDYHASAAAFDRLVRARPDDPRVREGRLTMAWACFHTGRPLDALRLASEGLMGPEPGLPDRSAEWLYLQANAERQLLKFDDAARSYARLLKEHPAHPLAGPAALEHALTLARAGRHAEAIAAARGLPAEIAARREIVWLLAEAHAALDDHDAAVQFYRLYNERFGGDALGPDALYRLGDQLRRRGDLAGAAEQYGRLAAQSPRHELAPQALFAAGACLAQAGRHDEAVRDWTALLQAHPTNAVAEEAAFRKGMSQLTLKRDTQAQTTLRDFLRAYPRSRFAPEAHFWLGVMADEAGRHREAEESLRLALTPAADPELAMRIRFRLAMVLQRTGGHDESAALFRDLLNSSLRDKFTPGLLEWLAEYQLARNDYPAALAAARVLRERFDDAAWQQVAARLEGIALLGLDRRGDAETALRRAADAELATLAGADAALRLGALCLAGGRPEAAAAAYDRAARLAADDALVAVRARAYAGLGRAHKAQGHDLEAARHFMAVAILFDDPELTPDCLREAAEAYERAGLADEAGRTRAERIARYPSAGGAAQP